MYKIILLICLVWLSNFTMAQNSKLFALHINGINVTQDDADKNLIKLHSVTQNASKMIFKTVYNPTRTPDEWEWVAMMKGAIDVWLQKWHEQNVLPTLDEFAIQAMKAQGLDYPIDSLEFMLFENTLVDQFKNIILDNGGKNMRTVIDNFHKAVPYQYASVLDLLGNNEQNDYVILLPHSQGNLYANGLYSYLTSVENFNKEHISIFGFASPASAELGQLSCYNQTTNYVTSKNDGIIELARHLTSGTVLQSNIIIPKIKTYSSGHDLIGVYLANIEATNFMNDFIFSTAENCFKSIQFREQIATVNSANKIIYDKTSKYLFQVDGNNQICELDTSNSQGWVCNNYKYSDDMYLSPDSLSTDGLGSLYVIGYHGLKLYIIAFTHKEGISTITEITSPAGFSNTKYYQGGLVSLNAHDLHTIDISSKTYKKYNLFPTLTLYGNSPYDIDSSGNIYVFDSKYNPQTYSQQIQIYYQQIKEDSEVKQFAVVIKDPTAYDIFISQNMLYVCGRNKTYYLPLNLSNNNSWFTLEGNCNQITGDNEYLFLNDYNQVYRYKLSDWIISLKPRVN